MNRTALYFVAAAMALLAFLGTRGLNEPDEGRYAEIGREMVVSGDWLIPHLNGFPHFQKPPVIYWMTAASLGLFGINEWAARLPSALAAFGTLALTFWMGRLLFGAAAARAALLVLISCVGFFALARLLTPDMTLTFWITAAIACWVRYTASPPQRRWVWLGFAAMGLGFLTKGPMALVVPLSAMISWQLATRRTAGFRSVPWVRGLALSLLIGLSWFIVLAVWRHDLFEYFWRYELVERFASSAHGRSRPFWFFVPILPVAFLPWTILGPSLIRRAWQKFRQRQLTPAQWFLLGWVIVPFVILSLSGSKLPTYILPILPALALASAAWLTRSGSLASWTPRLAIGALVVLLTAAALAPRFNNLLAQQASVRELAERLEGDPALKEARIYSFDVRAQGFPFYLGRTVGATRESSDIVLPTTAEDDARLLSTKKFKAAQILPAAGESPVVLLTRLDRTRKTFRAESWSVIGRAGDFVLLRSHPHRQRP